MTTIKRAELIAVVKIASLGLTPSSREKYLRVAESMTAVAVGWFHCEGANCPARQAKRHNTAFQERFDKAMWRLLGLDPGDTVRVEVEDD
jgi:hypothetical protein